MKWGLCMVCGNCHDLDMSACPTGGDTLKRYHLPKVEPWAGRVLCVAWVMHHLP
jgi:hypothetical protein